MMFKVAQETCTLPSSMIISHIELASRNPVHGGGCADIFRGLFGQYAIALKVLRIFNEADMKAVLPVYLITLILSLSLTLRKELYKEAIVWRQLNHNNVASFLGFCKDLFPDRIALVSPWMTNGDLSSFLKSNPEANRLRFVSLDELQICLRDLFSSDFIGSSDSIWYGLSAFPRPPDHPWRSASGKFYL